MPQFSRAAAHLPVTLAGMRWNQSTGAGGEPACQKPGGFAPSPSASELPMQPAIHPCGILDCGGIPAHGRGWEQNGLYGPFQARPFCDALGGISGFGEYRFPSTFALCLSQTSPSFLTPSLPPFPFLFFMRTFYRFPRAFWIISMVGIVSPFLIASIIFPTSPFAPGFSLVPDDDKEMRTEILCVISLLSAGALFSFEPLQQMSDRFVTGNLSFRGHFFPCS